MHARVLGYLILHAPSLNAQNEIAGQIHDCHENKEVLLTLGEYFLKYFIRPCRFRVSFVGQGRNASLTSFSQKVQRPDSDAIFSSKSPIF